MSKISAYQSALLRARTLATVQKAAIDVATANGYAVHIPWSEDAAHTTTIRTYPVQDGLACKTIDGATFEAQMRARLASHYDDSGLDALQRCSFTQQHNVLDKWQVGLIVAFEHPQ